MLLNKHCNLLLLSLESLVLTEMFRVLGREGLENFLLSNGALIDFHELFDCVQLVVHSYTIVHDLLFALADSLKLVKLVLDSEHSWVILESTWLHRLRDHLGKLLARFAEEHEALLV